MDNNNYYTKWFPLLEFPNSQYEINRKGEVRNKTTGNQLNGTINKDGYLIYNLTVDGKVYGRMAHILVAKQFIPNPNNYPVVNHKDENKTNPCVDNLEWVTYAQNSKYGKAQVKSADKRSVMVNEYDLDGTYIRTWKSAKDIYLYFGLPYDRKNRTTYLVKILTHNDNPDSDKIIFANRVFMRYCGQTNNISFTLKAPSNYRNNIYQNLSKPENVPAQYIFNPDTVKINADVIISEMLKQKQGLFTPEESDALKYAVALIKKSRKEKGR